MQKDRSSLKAMLARYAPVVFWAGIIVLLLGALVLASGLTAGSGRGPVPTEYMLVAGLVLLVISALMRPDALRELFGVRSVRHGSNALVFTIAFLAILGLINYLGTQQRFNLRQDFTSNKQFTLSDQTIQVLQTLKEPVRATAFFGGQVLSNQQEVTDRLREYALRSNGKLTYTLVDPDERPDLVQELGITLNGSVVFQGSTKKQVADIVNDESAFTQALIKLMSDKQNVAYFIQGHKEGDPNEFADAGYATARQALERENYAVDVLNLQVTSTVPASATLLILAGPQTELIAVEVTALDAYLTQGGRLLLMSDPGKPADALNGLMAKWGIKFGNDEVVDPVSAVQTAQGPNPLIPLIVRYPSSAITDKINGLPSAFPFARSVQRLTPPPTAALVGALVQTSAQSWGESNLDFTPPVQYDEGKDLKGPVDIAVSIESSPADAAAGAKKTRIVVFGTSSFMNNLWLSRLQGAVNTDLFLNSINWLAEDEDLISIRPTPPDQRQLVMTGNQLSTIFLVTVILLPALVFVGGFSIWWRRR